MKHAVKSIAIALAAGFTLLAGTAAATGNSKPLPYATYTRMTGGEASFNLKLTKRLNSESIHVTIEKSEGKRLNIALVGPDGATLGQFTTQRKPGIIEVDYNFFGAEEGTYTLQASDGKEKVSKKIILSRTSKEVVTEMHIQ